MCTVIFLLQSFSFVFYLRKIFATEYLYIYYMGFYIYYILRKYRFYRKA